MVDDPAPREKGREHETGEGRTPPARVMRSGAEGEASRLTRSTEPVEDPNGPMVTGTDAPEPLDEPEDLQG